MNPPTVLLERTFVAALIDPADPDHQSAARCYLELVDEFGRDERLLTVTSHTRRALGAAGDDVLAPAATLHVAGQERHAAQHVRLDGLDGLDGLGGLGEEAGGDLALNLVLLHRHRIAAVATFDRRYHAFDVDVLPGSTD
ncbi:MAG: hypothetical protein ABW195_07220 [Ilumatobacteraceae bacterium]